MHEKRLTPSNHGVVVRMDHRAPNEPHATGTVLAYGGGVPWLMVGQRVLYAIAEATAQWVDIRDYAHIAARCGQTGGSNPVTHEMVHLIDQRAIHATLNEPKGEPVALAG
jgi:hypothetical protein